MFVLPGKRSVIKIATSGPAIRLDIFVLLEDGPTDDVDTLLKNVVPFDTITINPQMHPGDARAFCGYANHIAKHI